MESNRRASGLRGMPRLHFDQPPSPALSGTLSRAAGEGSIDVLTSPNILSTTESHYPAW